MFDLLSALFFSVGLVVSAFAISYFFVWLREQFRNSSARKQAHEKRVVTLLESIDHKLDSMP